MKTKSDKPVIHLYIQGACGNQFFQYAFARNMQEKLDADLVINYAYVKRDTKLWSGSDNLLKDFNVVPYEYEGKAGIGGLIFDSIRWYRNIFRLKNFYPRTYRAMVRWAKWLPKLGIYYFDAAYYPFELSEKKDIYIYGYFESTKYFGSIDDKLKKELTPKEPSLESNKELLQRICDTESVCITIKRQDIENEDISDIYHYDLDYFYKAMDYIRTKVDNPVWVIFSDDIEWCRNNLKIDGEVLFETDGNPIWEKIRLMSSCKHFVIHNSTFSWWVQHLSNNANKIVVAPSKWMIRDDQPIDIYEDGWVYLNKDNEIVTEHE